MHAKKARARLIIRTLRRAYRKKPEDFVRWQTPLELVVGTVLSAQCTDKRVNLVTAELFKKYKTAEDYAKACLPALEREIHSTGFYKVKAKYLKGIGKIVSEKFKGEVPQSFKDLLLLPGVSHKTAHLVMAKAFGKQTGIAVDTHVMRLAPRLGLTKQQNPDKIGRDLEKWFPPKDYLDVNEYFILHGRAVCKAGRPLCGRCVLKEICPTGRRRVRSILPFPRGG